jgi:hypothetical protein
MIVHPPKDASPDRRPIFETLIAYGNQRFDRDQKPLDRRWLRASDAVQPVAGTARTGQRARLTICSVVLPRRASRNP